jgi:hypothetical protein
VTAVKVALGQDPPGSGGAEEPAADDQGSKEPSSEKPSSKEPASKEPDSEKSGSKEPSSKKPSSEKPASEKPASKEPASKKPAGKEASKEPSAKEPSSKEPGSAKGEDEPGGGAGAGMVVLDTTSTQQLVTLKLKAEQQTLAHIGEVAPVTLPGDRVARGRITEVGSVAETKESPSGEKGASGESESATIAVTLTLEHPVAHLDAAPVSVELLKSIRHEVLTVPATALTATAGSGYAIETLQDGRRVALTVTPGMFADGNVQVEGPGVREGLTVIESE